MSAPLLRTSALTKNFAKNRGVGPIDLVLHEGIHGLLGPNGSGKTTFIKTLLGFHDATSGSAELLGLDTQLERLAVRRQVGYMAENDVILPGLSAVQTVRFAAELCGVPAAHAHEAAAEAMHAVGLGDERFHNPARLSTGQRQKVKLASALVHAPRVLFLDEPTNGLDPQARVEFMELIKEMAHEKQMSILLSTHILPDVEALCDTAVVLRGGRLVAVEDVNRRRVLQKGQDTWFKVEPLGGRKQFITACKAQKWQLEESQDLRVLAPSAEHLLKLAHKNGILLASVAPATHGMEEAVLAHMVGA